MASAQQRHVDTIKCVSSLCVLISQGAIPAAFTGRESKSKRLLVAPLQSWKQSNSFFTLCLTLSDGESMLARIFKPSTRALLCRQRLTLSRRGSSCSHWPHVLTLQALVLRIRKAYNFQTPAVAVTSVFLLRLLETSSCPPSRVSMVVSLSSFLFLLSEITRRCGAPIAH